MNKMTPILFLPLTLKAYLTGPTYELMLIGRGEREKFFETGLMPLISMMMLK